MRIRLQISPKRTKFLRDKKRFSSLILNRIATYCRSTQRNALSNDGQRRSSHDISHEVGRVVLSIGGFDAMRVIRAQPRPDHGGGACGLRNLGNQLRQQQCSTGLQKKCIVIVRCKNIATNFGGLVLGCLESDILTKILLVI